MFGRSSLSSAVTGKPAAADVDARPVGLAFMVLGSLPLPHRNHSPMESDAANASPRSIVKRARSAAESCRSS
jgi:hypothetical protein